MLFVEQNINLNKNKTELKIENPTDNLRKVNPVLQLK